SQERSEIKISIHAKAGHRDFAREQRAVGRAGVTKVGVSGGTHAGRVTQSHVLAGGCQVEVEAIAVCKKASQIEFATAAVSSELFDLHAILGKHHGAVDVAEPIGKVHKRNTRIYQFEFSVHLRMSCGTQHVHGENSRTVGQDVGIEALGQLEIDPPS